MVQWCKKKKQNLCGTQFTISKQWEQIYDHSGQQRSDTIFFFKKNAQQRYEPSARIDCFQ